MGLFGKSSKQKARPRPIKRMKIEKTRPKAVKVRFEAKHVKPKKPLAPAVRNTEIVKKTKSALHDIYFSKKMEEKEKTNELAIRDVSKNVAASGKENEKRIADMETRIAKRMDDIEKSMLAIRGIIDEFRKENEELRKDRQFFVEKLKTSMTEHASASEVFENIGPEGEEVPPGRATPATYQEGSKKVQTSMDALLDLVAAKGSIKLSAAAKKLRVKEKDAEEWARVLEEHELLEVRYPTFGSPILKKKK